MYHYVRNVEETDYRGIKALSVVDFITQIDWLQEHHPIVDYPTFISQLQGPEKYDSTLLTFDDGLIDHYQTAFPILEQRGLSGVFFLCENPLNGKWLNVHKIHFLLARLGAETFTREVQQLVMDEVPAFKSQELYRLDTGADAHIKKMLNFELPYDVATKLLNTLFNKHIPHPPELYMTPAMLLEMSQGGMTLGIHTKTHPVLSRLHFEEQQEEILAGLRHVQKLTSQDSIPFSYPYGSPGSFNKDTLQILEATPEINAAFAVNPEKIMQKHSHFALPRYDTKDLPPFVTNFQE